MANLYYYLIASLPMLHFGMKAPFSWDIFLDKCAGLIPGQDYEILEHLPKTEESRPGENSQPTIKKWIAFDTAIRNELVKLRASRKHIEPQTYLRPDGYTAYTLAQIAQAIQRNPSPLEGERTLDELRWQALEELSLGHYFDLDFLIIYAYKLLILERWLEVRGAVPQVLLEAALSQ